MVLMVGMCSVVCPLLLPWSLLSLCYSGSSRGKCQQADKQRDDNTVQVRPHVCCPSPLLVDREHRHIVVHRVKLIEPQPSRWFIVKGNLNLLHTELVWTAF